MLKTMVQIFSMVAMTFTFGCSNGSVGMSNSLAVGSPTVVIQPVKTVPSLKNEIVLLIPPPSLHAGSVTLKADVQHTFGLSEGYFDFDENRVVTGAQVKDHSDIYYGLAVGRYVFLVLAPSSMGGTLIDSKIGGIADHTFLFNIQDCLVSDIHYGHGGIGIPYIGATYCWITEDGRVAEFFVDDITEVPGDNDTVYKININYTV
jgi:hypothetical protein